MCPEPAEPRPDKEPDEALHTRLSVELSALVEDYYREARSRSICREGEIAGQETGTPTKGNFRIMRLLGRIDMGFFIEVDPVTDEPLERHVFRIEESGEVDGLDTLMLGKVLAIARPENSHEIDIHRFGEMTRKIDEES